MEEGWASIAAHAEATWREGLMTARQFAALLVHLSHTAQEITRTEPALANEYLAKARAVDSSTVAGFTKLKHI